MAEVNQQQPPQPPSQCSTAQESKVFPSINVTDFQKMSTVGNLLFALVGIIAGLYYFFKRLNVENQRDRVSRVREYAKILLSYIDEYDKTVNSAINAQSLKVMGKSRRDETNRIFQSIQHFLEANQDLFKLCEEEMQNIMEFHSVIDNSKLSRGQYSNGSQASIRSDYKIALKKARTICWKKLY